jgi:hypothetical protein
MNDLADTTERPPIVRQGEPPRVNVHVDLHAISHDLQTIRMRSLDGQPAGRS